MADFKYYNVNPELVVEEDCVCRAITLASGLPYRTVEKLLWLVAEHNDCDMLCLCCYEHLLTEVMGYAIKYPINKVVEEIVDEYPNNALIIRIDGHLLCAINGIVYDLWNSFDEEVTCFWIVS